MFCPKCGVANDDQSKFCQKCGANLPTVAKDAAPGEATPQQAAVSASGVEYAGFWKRLAAWIIDAVLVWIVVIVFSIFFRPWVGPWRHPHPVSVVFFWLIASWIYWALLESSSSQATLGKMALGIIVTDMEGKRISFARATGRHWAKIISSIILYIGHIMIAFTSRKQGLHDLIADCLVVVKK